MRLLVTRPVPDGERTAAALRARGHDVVMAPLLVIEPIADVDLGAGPWSGVVLTSLNAVRAGAQHVRRVELLRLPAYAVGRRTADAARAAGFEDVTSADGDARDLVREIARRHHGRAPLLYLAGADRSADLGRDLAPLGLQVVTVVTYRAVQATTFPPAARDVLTTQPVQGVLHFSRRTAAAFVCCAEEAGVLDPARAWAHYCLSVQVSEPLVAAGMSDIRVSPHPDEAALLALVGVCA